MKDSLGKKSDRDMCQTVRVNRTEEELQVQFGIPWLVLFIAAGLGLLVVIWRAA